MFPRSPTPYNCKMGGVAHNCKAVFFYNNGFFLQLLVWGGGGGVREIWTRLLRGGGVWGRGDLGLS